MNSVATAPQTDPRLTALVYRVAQQNERIDRLEATLRALARLSDGPPTPEALTDTRPLASAPTPPAVPWPVRRPSEDGEVPATPDAHGFLTLGRAVAGVAHDLNNLLAAVRGFADLLADQTPPGDPRRPLVDDLAGVSDLASGVARQLLCLVRPAGGPPQADVNEVVGRVERVVRALGGARVRLAVEAAADLPAARVPPAELAQVVLNLCLNGCEAMPDGGTLTVRTGAASGAFVVLTVGDTGDGMGDATRARALDPGFTTKADGRGLGLMAVRDIVARAGGHVEFEAAPGRGTLARVYFPAG